MYKYNCTFECRIKQVDTATMKENEILKVVTDQTNVVIVDNILFVGSPDHESEKHDVSFQFDKGILSIDGWDLSEAQLLILKMFINKEL